MKKFWIALVLAVTCFVGVGVANGAAVTRYLQGLTVMDGVTVKAAPDIEVVNSTANAVMDALVLERSVTTSTAGADSLGVGLVFQLETETNATIDEAATIDVVWTDATANTTDSKINFSVRVADTTTNTLTLTSPGVLQVHDGTVPTFTVATAAGELAVEGDFECDANIDIAGTSQFTGVATFSAAPVFNAAQTVNITDANTNTDLTGLTINRSVTGAGVGATGLSGSLAFGLETATASTVDPAGTIAYSWSDATANSTDSDLTFSIRAADATLAAARLASPGVFQVYAGGTVPTFSVATLAGEVGIEGDLEVDANVDIAGTLNVAGATITLGDNVADALTINAASTINVAPGIVVSDANTNTVMNGMSITRSVDSTGVGAAALGNAITFYLETDTDTTTDQSGQISTVWVDPAVASTDSTMKFSIRVADANVNPVSIATPGVLQVHDGTVPTFGVATAAGELGVEGDIECDANLDVAGTSNFAGATMTIGDASGDAVVSNSGAWSFPNDVTITATHVGVTGEIHGGTLVSTGLTTAATLAVTTPTTVEYLLSSTAAVDVSGVAEHVLYTVPAGKTAIITKVILRSCSGTLDMATDAVAQWGCNAGTHNDVIGAKTLTAPTGTSSYQILLPTASNATGNVESALCAAAAEFTMSVTTSSTTSTTCTVDTWGFLF